MPNPLNLTDHDFDGLIQIGFLAQALGPFHNLTMLPAVNAMIEANLTDLLRPALIAGGAGNIDPRLPLSGLKLVLQQVPHDNSSFSNVVGYIVVTSITIAMFMLRMYSRKYVTKRIRPEDWAMLAATIVAVGLGLTFILGSDVRVGRGTTHIWDLTFDQFKTYLLWLFINEIVYPVALFLVRNSLLIFYWCLTPSSSHIFRRIVILFFFINFTCMAVSLGTIIWQCNPIDWWNHPLTAKCVDRDATFLAGSILIVLTDVFTLLLPIPLVMSLKLARKEKVMVIGMFCLGFLACICSINRIIRVKEVTGPNTGDITYKNAHSGSGIWSLLEVDIAIITSCAPAIKAIWMKAANSSMLSRPCRSTKATSSSYTKSSKYTSSSGSGTTKSSSTWSKKSRSEHDDTIRLKSMGVGVSVCTTIDVDTDLDLEQGPVTTVTADGNYIHFSRPFMPDDPRIPPAGGGSFLQTMQGARSIVFPSMRK